MKTPRFTDTKRYPRPYVQSGATDIGAAFKLMRDRERKMLRDWDAALAEYVERESVRKSAVVQPIARKVKS